MTSPRVIVIGLDSADRAWLHSAESRRILCESDNRVTHERSSRMHSSKE
jgi:hypothetical protein